MKERLRAPLAAAVALLIGGDLAVRGPDALLDVWRYLVPYLLMFLAFEFLRRRRRLLDEEAFLLGAAAGLLHDGALTKVLQDGTAFLGLDLLSASSACFDWGLTTVVALHVCDALLPRPEEDGAARPLFVPELIAFVFLPAAALLLYVFDALLGRTRIELELGSVWPLTDLLFVIAAAALARRALSRAAAEEPGERERGLWALAVFCAWLPGAQLAARAGGEWPSLISWVYVLAWTGVVGVWTRMLWRERGHVDIKPRRAVPAILILAAWRLAGAVLVNLTGAVPDADGVNPAAFTFLVDLPTRLVFLTMFFSARLAV